MFKFLGFLLLVLLSVLNCCPADSQQSGLANFTIYANADFSQLITVTDSTGEPINFTGYTAKMTIGNAAPPTTTYLTIQSTGMNPAITFPQPLQGQLQILIPQSVTSTLNFQSGVYDLLLFSPSGGVNQLIHGNITLSPGVTSG